MVVLKRTLPQTVAFKWVTVQVSGASARTYTAWHVEQETYKQIGAVNSLKPIRWRMVVIVRGKLMTGRLMAPTSMMTKLIKVLAVHSDQWCNWNRTRNMKINM